MPINKALAAISLLAVCASGATPAANAYIQHNLVADTAGVADLTDPNLINPWGISFSAASPFWVSDNGTGLSTLYSTSVTSTISAVALKVSIPGGAASGDAFGPVTGQVSNFSTAFLLANGTKASFIFCTEDGTISAWNGGAAATNMVDRSSKGAVFKGMAVAGTAAAPLLFVANFNAGTIEVYDGNFAPVTLTAGAFTDPQLPAGFAPFNVVNINGKLYVTYAKQDSTKHDDVAGAGNGFVDVFDMNGGSLQRLISGGALNSPWGVALAPANFGLFSGDLLVGNFGDGHVNVYDPAAGTPLGALQDTKGNTIAIPGLWALAPGNGKSGGDTNAVYFTAGPGGEKHGLLGSLQAGPVGATTNPILNGADFAPGISQYSWISIFGSNLSSTTRTWLPSDMPGGKLPTQLDNVTVTVNGKPAYVEYISPVQINALMPADLTLGPVQISTTNQGLASGTLTAQMAATTPAFFITKNNYAAALHSNNTVVGPAGLYPNSSPAAPNETIMLFATGFGPGNTPIPDGQILTTPVLLSGVTVMVGGSPANVTFQGLVMPGLYQINVTIPPGTANGDAQVVGTVGSSISPTGPLISVHN
jgi:uncharacterized protein (TIGR03118 family)